MEKEFNTYDQADAMNTLKEWSIFYISLDLNGLQQHLAQKRPLIHKSIKDSIILTLIGKLFLGWFSPGISHPFMFIDLWLTFSASVAYDHHASTQYPQKSNQQNNPKNMDIYTVFYSFQTTSKYNISSESPNNQVRSGITHL